MHCRFPFGPFRERLGELEGNGGGRLRILLLCLHRLGLGGLRGIVSFLGEAVCHPVSPPYNCYSFVNTRTIRDIFGPLQTEIEGEQTYCCVKSIISGSIPFCNCSSRLATSSWATPIRYPQPRLSFGSGMREFIRKGIDWRVSLPEEGPTTEESSNI